MVLRKISAEKLKTPIDLGVPANEQETEDDVVDSVTKLLYSAKNPVILVDACAVRHRVVDEVHQLIDKSQLPAFATPMVSLPMKQCEMLY